MFDRFNGVTFVDVPFNAGRRLVLEVQGIQDGFDNVPAVQLLEDFIEKGHTRYNSLRTISSVDPCH